MRWKQKAAIQKAIAKLPDDLSYAAYYEMQRRFGGFQNFDPMSRLSAGVKTWRRLTDHGYDPVGKRFLEVGTGRAPFTPLAFWLMGAEQTVTIDLNPYVKDELLNGGISYMQHNVNSVRSMFGDLLDEDRLDEILALPVPSSRERILQTGVIEYIAPGDASATGLPDQSVDFITSYTVFEHIPPSILHDVLVESARIQAVGGAHAHFVDYSDHFAHQDSSISHINFLQYDDAAWDRIAGNRYMYMNRLRHDDTLALFTGAGHQVLFTHLSSQAGTAEALSTLPVNRRFRGKDTEVLQTTAAWIISETPPESVELRSAA